MIQWCTQHKDDPTQPVEDENNEDDAKEEEEENEEDDNNEDDDNEEDHNSDIVAHSDTDTDLFEYSICSWDAEFMKVDQGTLFELILVSC